MESRFVKGLILTVLSVAMAGQALSEPSADEIMSKSLLSIKVADSATHSTFRLINAAGQQRVRETDGQTKLIAGTTDNRRLVNFLSPADVRGTKTLLIEHSSADDDIWIYLPAMKKVRRLVASNKKDSFVGTDFSYGDVIGHKVEDWNHTLMPPKRSTAGTALSWNRHRSGPMWRITPAIRSASAGSIRRTSSPCAARSTIKAARF